MRDDRALWQQERKLGAAACGRRTRAPIGGGEPGSPAQGWSLTVNRGEPGFKGRIGCAGFVHPSHQSHRAHRWAKVCF